MSELTPTLTDAHAAVQHARHVAQETTLLVPVVGALLPLLPLLPLIEQALAAAMTERTPLPGTDAPSADLTPAEIAHLALYAEARRWFASPAPFAVDHAYGTALIREIDRLRAALAVYANPAQWEVSNAGDPDCELRDLWTGADGTQFAREVLAGRWLPDAVAP